MEDRSETGLTRTAIDVAVILAAAAAVSLPCFVFGIPEGNDRSQHYQTAITLLDALRSGDIYPGWAAGQNSGFGDVAIRFYPPLSYYPLVILKLALGSWSIASAC